MLSTRTSCVGLLFVLVAHFALSAPKEAKSIYGTAADRQPAIETSLYGALEPVIKASDGQVTAAVRAAYLDWATNVVLTSLSRAHQSVSDDCLAEVSADPAVADAMYRAVFPPDPSILQNYARWRAKLGPEFATKYRSLVIAFSVAKRVDGVETTGEMDTVPLSAANRKAVSGRDAQGNYQPGFWADEALKPVKSREEKAFVSGIADFMRTNQVAALELYKNPSRQTQLAAFLRERGIAPRLIAEVKPSGKFGERLKNAMVLLGQRPAAREKKPDTESWLRYLVAIHEAQPSSVPEVDGKTISWPLFPIQQAPWPLLMPLAHRVPLGEARYIWETFQGRHGPDRFHTYGPFRDGSDALPYELQPSAWFWDAWPDRIFHGGECVSISKGTVDFYSSLGRPAVWAGQPGHANLISFKRVKGAWAADVEQAFAGGPDVTYAQWYFEDDPARALRFRQLYHWAGAEYHLGLALGMNRGLQSYLDTRMAANIFNAMPAAEQPTLGAKLLRHAAEANPFNPDLWYRLALLTPDPLSGLTFMQRLTTQAPDEPGYWRTVEACAAHFCIMDRPVPQTEAELHRVCVFLQTLPGIKFEEMEAYAARFYQALADKNDAYGQTRMGERYLDGIGVEKDESQARKYFGQAAAQGNEEAARALNRLDATIPGNAIVISASSQYSADQAVRHLVSGEGMWRGLHDNNGAARTMWHSVSNPAMTAPAPGLPPSPAWVKCSFLAPKNLGTILIWNLNQAGLTDRGFRKTDLYGSADGTTWFRLTPGGTIELPRAGGQAGLAPVTIAVTAPTPVKSVIIAANAAQGNYGSDCYGLSALRFLVGNPPVNQ